MRMKLAADVRTIFAGGMQFGKVPLPSVIDEKVDTDAAAVEVPSSCVRQQLFGKCRRILITDYKE